jgi:hypothetical protein
VRGKHPPGQLSLPQRRDTVTPALREHVVMALGCAERARRELHEANEHMRQIVNALGISHPSVGKIAGALRDATTATHLLGELRSRLP